MRINQAEVAASLARQLGLWETYASRAFKHEEQSAMTREATPPTYNAQLNLPEDDYGSLLLRDKLFLIRPHLVKILNDQYQPALELADAFYSSKNLSLQAGDMSQRVVEEILVPELLRWGLRAEWSVGLPEVAVRGLIRPTGSQRYEVLSPEKKEEVRGPTQADLDQGRAGLKLSSFQ